MKKTNLRKAAISALLMLIVAVVSLTGVTYAWFTSGQTADVDNIQLTVDGAAGGLQIALDDNNFAFGSTVDFSSVNTGVTYKPVSTTVSALSNGNFFKGEIGSTAQMLKNITTATANADYFKQSILIDNYGGEAKTLQLSGEINADKETKLAVRIAIVIDGVNTAPTYTSADTFTPESQKQVYIYEPYATTHTNAGKNEAKLDGIAGNTGEAKYQYFGVSKTLPEGTTEINRYTAGADQVLESVTTYDLAAEGASTANITIQAGALVKATIYVWCEGQDHDCHNDIAGGTVNAGLTFTIVTPQQDDQN